MKSKYILPFLMLFSAQGIDAKTDKLHYTVSMDTAAHYLNVTLQYVPEHTLTTNDTLTLRLPMWAPGYYEVVNYPKYLTEFKVSANSSSNASYLKTDINAWSVTAQGADTIMVSYRVYANDKSVVNSRLESTCAFIAPNGVFMYPEGEKQHEALVTILLPNGWSRISTALERTDGRPAAGAENSSSVEGGKATYLSHNFDELYDSPLFCGNHFVDEFQHEGHGYEFALETPEGFVESGTKEDFKKVVTACTALMGDVPYKNYNLIHLGQGGGGLEHCNSQACYSNGTWRFPNHAEYINYLGFITHEYFHLYNVKRIRPIALGPFDYDHAVFTPMLWVSEGFTVYYETQLMLRAGIITSEELLSELSGYIQNIETHEGQKRMSLRESSTDIWVNFFYQYEAPNGKDTKVNYYIKGPVIGLIFDAMLRDATNGKASLDDLMRLLYNRYYKHLGRGFTEEEFWQSVCEIAGTGVEGMRNREVTDQLANLVNTTAPIPYDKVLSLVGLEVDHTTWQLSMQQKTTKQALKLRKALLGK